MPRFDFPLKLALFGVVLVFGLWGTDGLLASLRGTSLRTLGYRALIDWEIISEPLPPPRAPVVRTDFQPDPGVDIEALYAQADANAGAPLLRNCRSCHSIDAGVNTTGPSLYGVVGRSIGSVTGFNYSGALDQVGETWTVPALARFLANPRVAAPGTRMTFRGIADLRDRLNLIRFLQDRGD